MNIQTNGQIIDLDAEELVALARIDMEKGVMDQALIKLKHAIQIDNHSPDAFAMAARVYAQIGLFNKAQVLFERYLAINPSSTLERFQYGMVLFDLGQKSNALNVWNELLDREPIHPPALFFKSAALVDGGRLDEARDTLSRIFKTVAIDNLYFSKAKELLQSLDRGTQGAAHSSLQAYGGTDKASH